MTTFDTVVYHFPCWDGLVAGWVCRGIYPEAELVPQDYHKKIDVEAFRDKRVLMVDYCPPGEDFHCLVEAVEHLTLLDHHKGAKDTLEGYSHPKVDLTFDMERSGAGLAWDFTQGPAPRPPLVRCVEDRDLWRFAHDDTKAFCAALDRQPLTFEALDEVAKTSYGLMIAQGTPVVEHIESSAMKIGDRAFYAVTPTEFGADKVLLVNGTKEIASAVGSYLNKKEPTVPAVIWYHDAQGYRLSIRSNDGQGLSAMELAQKFGGNGHPAAAGAMVATSPGDWSKVSP